MHRFFTDRITGGDAWIEGDDVRHIARVLRLRAGDELTLCDGQGHDYDGVIAALSDERVTCSIGPARPSKTEPKCRITLFQCLPKSGKLETILQKGTELGCADFVPVISRRCVTQPGGSFEVRRVRCQRVAEEAAKQSRRGVIPRFLQLTAIEEIDPAAFELFLLAYEEERTVSLKSALKKRRGVKSVGILIGPEGGFEPDEAARIVDAGAISVSLGERILRTETAGMAMLAQILYEVER